MFEKSPRTAAALLIVAAFSTPALAEDDHRQHKAHVHGAGQLAVAVDGTQLEIELDAPAANFLIVEYDEHAGMGHDEQSALGEQLKQADALFKIDDAAGCTVQAVSVATSEVGGHHDEHAHDEHAHDEHAHDERAHDEHAHEEHAHDEHHHDDHAHEEHAHEEHAHEEHDHDEHAKHLDVEARYTYKCATPSALEAIDVRLMKLYPRFEALEAVVLTASGQSAQTLTAKNMTLKVQ